MVLAAPTTTPTTPRQATPEHVGQVVRAAQHGEAEAFGWLYDNYFDALVRYAETMLRSHQQAEDAAQSAFERVLTRISTYDPERGTFIAWAMSITRHVVYDTYKAQSRRAETPTAEHLAGYAATDDGDHASVMATREWLAARLAALPFRWSQAVTMRFYMGMSVTETATALGISETNVRKRTFDGIRRINADMTDADRDTFGFGAPTTRTVTTPAPAPGAGLSPQRTAS